MVQIKNKKANAVGIAIIAMAALLLLGGIFMDDTSTNSKSKYLDKKEEGDKKYPEETYLFYLNSTDIGRQKKVTTSFPNIELGAKIEHNIVHLENNFKLKANPFANNVYSFNANFDRPQEVEGFYLYFDLDRYSGEQDIMIKVNDKMVYLNQARPSEIPLIINGNLGNASTLKISFEAVKPRWYSIFNWNSFEVKNLKVVEIRRNKNNDVREYNFDVNKDTLERIELNLVIDCGETPDSSYPIKVNVNGYTLADFNPDCKSYVNKITKEIPIHILNSKNNKITMKTEGYYNLAYGFNHIYFNDQDTYKFTIGSFNDIIDIVMYGDFDKDVIDVKINKHLISLERDEIVSIIPYIRYGTNEIEFLTKPVELEEFVIEKNEFLY